MQHDLLSNLISAESLCNGEVSSALDFERLAMGKNAPSQLQASVLKHVSQCRGAQNDITALNMKIVSVFPDILILFLV
jgi:hypothetical protein